ncbi:hypothetical protein AAFF_G00125090 [Aldrovandia affinis]|uniref:Uncharacterized protein n=1 Tax=Aldrovandia affinis TaxID=143900 RepID=A0AAD7W9Y4_9TELE|nr:hypothetical protein AAFF_G00125090 [Aldrovandia affinis]
MTLAYGGRWKNRYWNRFSHTADTRPLPGRSQSNTPPLLPVWVPYQVDLYWWEALPETKEKLFTGCPYRAPQGQLGNRAPLSEKSPAPDNGLLFTDRTDSREQQCGEQQY